MEKRVLGQSIQTIETTVGELIEAVTQIALEAGRTEEEGYELASLTLENILRRSKCDVEAIN
jgi:hypothetical protein